MQRGIRRPARLLPGVEQDGPRCGRGRGETSFGRTVARTEPLRDRRAAIVAGEKYHRCSRRSRPQRLPISRACGCRRSAGSGRASRRGRASCRSLERLDGPRRVFQNIPRRDQSKLPAGKSISGSRPVRKRARGHRCPPLATAQAEASTPVASQPPFWAAQTKSPVPQPTSSRFPAEASVAPHQRELVRQVSASSLVVLLAGAIDELRIDAVERHVIVPRAGHHEPTPGAPHDGKIAGHAPE